MSKTTTNELKTMTYNTPMGWDEWFMRMVYLLSSKSKDPSSKIGAVLTKENQIISTGYNGFPTGVSDDIDRYNERLTKYKYVVHAEHNTILAAAKFGISTNQSILYTNQMPCNECTKAIIQAGIHQVVIHKQWPEINKNWKESEEITKIMCKESGVDIKIFDKILGITGFQLGKEINV